VARAELKAETKDVLALPQGLRLLPPVDPTFGANESALVLFWLEGLPVGDAPPRFTMDVTAVGPDGATATLPGGLAFFELDGTRYRGVVRASLAGLAPGAWQIRVGASGETPDARAETRLPIVIAVAPTSSSP
jgi:hypothetical protein